MTKDKWLELVAEAHRDYIKARERRREVFTQAISAGVSSAAIAATTWLSGSTVRGLIKKTDRADLEFIR